MFSWIRKFILSGIFQEIFEWIFFFIHSLIKKDFILHWYHLHPNQMGRVLRNDFNLLLSLITTMLEKEKSRNKNKREDVQSQRWKIKFRGLAGERLWKYHESYAMTREGNWRLRGCRGYFAIKCRKLTSFVSGSITVLDGRTLVKCTPVPCLPYFAMPREIGWTR